MDGQHGRDSNGKDAHLISSEADANVITQDSACLEVANSGPLTSAVMAQCGLEVRLRLDGRSVVAVIEIDPAEHLRRLELGVGAVTSTGLLHALWLLPSMIPVQPTALPEIKVARLRQADGVCAETGAGLERTYSPIGRVLALGASGANAQRVLDHVAMLPPIFRRAALVRPLPPTARGRLAQRALSARVGLAIYEEGIVDEVVVPAPEPIRGIPGVYRWWIAELVYGAWLQERIQPVS